MRGEEKRRRFAHKKPHNNPCPHRGILRAQWSLAAQLTTVRSLIGQSARSRYSSSQYNCTETLRSQQKFERGRIKKSKSLPDFDSPQRSSGWMRGGGGGGRQSGRLTFWVAVEFENPLLPDRKRISTIQLVPTRKKCYHCQGPIKQKNLRQRQHKQRQQNTPAIHACG